MWFLVVLLILAIWFGGAAIVMLAWNAVLPSLFHAPTVTYWQMFALLFLLGIVGNALRSRASSK